ncbi:MAG: DUF2871 domain-containing protein [Clostridium sp.]|uniref:DUF2871 domain-containing protein n=1 Tax=Clostridium sp. TaxID=1506 RepID=UPI0030301A9E
MKKLINTSFAYAIAAMVAGVFFREFTKFNGFTGKTSLSILHVHLFVLGMLFLLAVVLLDKHFKISKNNKFNFFFYVYNAGMIVSCLMFLGRGILQTLEITPSAAINASISGFSGIGHIMISVGIITFFLMLKSQITSIEEI